VYLSQITLQNFRSYKQKTIDFKSGVNLILGGNGSGKSNLLESIYFLSSGKSFRAPSLGQLILWGENFLSVRGKVENGGEKELEAQLILDNGSSGRRYYVDKVVKPKSKYLGNLRCVLFEPEDIRLITGSPNRRREFLDTIFVTSEWAYAQALSQYNRALKHRNELLDLIAAGRAKEAELFYWNQSLVKNAEIIHRFRSNFVKSVNQFWNGHENEEVAKLGIIYHPSVIDLKRLEVEVREEITLGYTKRGPHRDDFSIESQMFESEDKNLAFWGSRGQQRLAVLALRLAQINYLLETYKEEPVLLLDDIFSELDPEHRQLVANICHKYQTIFTSAEIESINYLPTAQTIKI
jgi:DNA replication and repair protein RecF